MIKINYIKLGKMSNVSKYDYSVWAPCVQVDLLKRVDKRRNEIENEIKQIVMDLRSEKFYPEVPSTQQIDLRVSQSFIPLIEANTDTTEETTANIGQWTLRVEGMDHYTGTTLNLSPHFRKVTIELDPSIYEDATIEWICFQKAMHHPVNGFEITRTGPFPSSLQLRFYPSASIPIERYAISPLLSRAISSYLTPGAVNQTFPKQEIIQATWEYIKRNNLIKEDDCRVIVCDTLLTEVFRCESLQFSSLVVALGQHLTKTTSIDVTHITNKENIPTTYQLNLVMGNRHAMKQREEILSSWKELVDSQNIEMDALQKQEQLILQELEKDGYKRQWLIEFARDPVGFMKDVAKSQLADEAILLMETLSDNGALPQASQFQEAWVRPLIKEFLTTPANQL